MQNDQFQLSRLKPFEAAARYESFTQAADELGLTQTAISRQISQLEAELGVALFERRNRAVFLTDEGRRLGQVITEALAMIRAEVETITGTNDPETVVLRCQLCEAFYWLMPRLSRFHAKYPEIQLQIVSALEPLTKAREPFDVALQTTGRASGSARLLFTATDEIFPVCAPALVSQSPDGDAEIDITQVPLLSHRVVPQDWFDWPEWFAANGQARPSDIQMIYFDSYPLVLQAAVAGQGVALGWGRTVEAMLEEGKLRKLGGLSLRRPNEISIFRGTKRTRHAAVDQLIAWLRSELA
ncbi:transcriptional regulator, LysR family [Cohaesibacter sp. ES.047]|uniref:LysR family transcriptional regulator n=1 Tax=Cohaesibacter sp. ES.047 TaxID=1798205 RepID=UPI000BB7AAF4|nr:LysR family transcriptional regulator [Cohaesibacter sp. ES.047]SNY93181.1 transcriptional regulator, LysR family [Cohaesibacter sp. ES.047]